MRNKKKVKTLSLVGISLLIMEIGTGTLMHPKDVFADTVETNSLNVSTNNLFNSETILQDNKSIIHTANPSLMWGPPGGNPFGKFADPSYRSPGYGQINHKKHKSHR